MLALPPWWLIDGQQRETVCRLKASGEGRQQVGYAVGRVGLEYRPEPTAVDLARGGERRPNRRGVVGVVVHQPDAALFVEGLESPLSSPQAGEGRGGFVGC